VRHRSVSRSPLEHARAVEIDESRNQHFGDAVQPLRERIERRRRLRPRAEAPVGLAERGVVAMAQHEGPGHRVAQGADADLQGAAVLDPSGDMQGHGVLGQADRLAWRGVERKFILGRVQDVVEGGGRLFGRSQHERQVVVDLSSDDQGIARAAPAPGYGQFVQGHVGVAAEAVMRLGALASPRHQLADDIDSLVRQQTVGLGIVDADVVALSHGRVEPAAGCEKKLRDMNIVRQAV
jgi:hypothetical protein